MVVKKETKTVTKSVTPKADSLTDNPNTLLVLTHLLGIFVGFLGSLIILLVSKETIVKNHARKALNWQITYLIVSSIIMVIFFAGALGSMLLMMINPLFLVVYLFSFILMIPLMVLSLVNIAFCIMAAIKANEGTLWDYPFSIPILKTE